MGRLLTVGHGTLDREGLAALLTGAGGRPAGRRAPLPRQPPQPRRRHRRAGRVVARGRGSTTAGRSGSVAVAAVNRTDES